MNSLSKNQSMHPLIEQITNNTTSWVGHRPGDNKEIVTGQTFIVPAEGDLEAIEIFSELVADPGKVVMKLFAFNSEKHTWGPELCNSSVEFNKNLNGQWVSFKMPKMHIHKGDTYGFKIESHNSFVGMGEAVGSASEPPFQTGQEWKFSDLDHIGHSYSYFSLAFKVDVRA